MATADWGEVLLYLALLVVTSWPLGRYMARVYGGVRTPLSSLLGPVEALLYRAAGVGREDEMTWRRYAGCVLLVSGFGLVAVMGLQELQGVLPGNPERLGPVRADLALNTAVSFVTNTNWQSYAGESTLSYLTQMLGLTVQNFLSAGTGMAVLVALTRGLARRSCQTIGSFWVDLTRGTLYVLLPLSAVLALALVSQGVVQTLAPYRTVEVAEAAGAADGASADTQVIAVGPAASQVAIKQLGTNGGGFFGANSAHPFENPTPLANLLELLAILLIPAALCHTYGELVGDSRQGWAVLVAMVALLIPALALCQWAERQPNPALLGLGVDQSAGNLEGKETRFGAAGSALWAAATTAASNGSVNAMHDSFLPLGGMAALWLMQLGEVAFGGVGAGLYGMLAFVVVAVFVAGLMVGRAPEYMGKKIEAFEMRMASLVLLLPVLTVLIGTATAAATPAGTAAVANPGAHGFSEVLYAFSSAGNNNGSAFAGLSASTPFYNLALGVAMLVGRFGVILPILALGGSLARKDRAAPGAGTLETHTPLFVAWLVAVVVVVGALSFFPALALGPIVEHLDPQGVAHLSCAP